MKSYFDSTSPTSVSSPQSKPIVTYAQANLELWGGLECTVNRVGDRYFNQCEWSGHTDRPSDLDLFASIGIRAVRYPVVWEMLAPESLDCIDWSFPDERLARLRELNIRPIVDLVHHGSGPRYAPIDSPAFAPGVERFAREVAQRYPWLNAYTPINEPLTTARFCGKNGWWFPHGEDDATFARVLINECKATVLAMRAIREVNPQAELIQTDDLGYIYSTPARQADADFQNARRWLGSDLLCGTVGTHHTLWNFLLENGISADEVCWFADNPCPPDLIGINYYPTSDRFLDENMDAEALRVEVEPSGGFGARLQEAWDRYHLPLAITEAHLGCTREEQVRWFYQAWQAALKLRDEGVDVRAVTAWSLLGAYNWNSLVTRDENYYEPGVFDLRGPQPRPTALAALLRDLSSTGDHIHPALETPGWWERPGRFLQPSQEEEPAWRLQRAQSSAVQVAPHTSERSRPLLILGATGTLGSDFARACELRALPYYALSLKDFDLREARAVEEAFAELSPWGVINASGYEHIDAAEGDAAACYALNTEAAVRVAEACARHNATLLCFSSEQVFDGTHHSPYVESDVPHPLNTYGRSKAAMEVGVAQAMPQALIVRTSGCFGRWAESSFMTRTLRSLAQGEKVSAAEDIVISPTFIPDLVRVSLDLLLDHESGLWHLTNGGEVTWAQLARWVAELQGYDRDLVQAYAHNESPHVAKRPLYSALGTERGALLPPLEESFTRFGREWK